MPRPGYKTIQFKDEDMAEIDELAGKLQSTLIIEFSKRQTVMHAVRTMLKNADPNTTKTVNLNLDLTKDG